jgi:hypothetical protein
MTTAPMDRVSERALNRTTLLRQRLLERRPSSVVDAVGALAGLQAQSTPSPYIALWSRLEGFAIADLVRALEERSIVKATLMRSTLHLVAAADYAAFAVPSGAAGAANWEPTIRRAGVDAGALHAGLLAFAATPRTVAELEAYLDAEAPDDVIAASAPGGVTHVAYRAISARGGLLHVPPGGVWGSSGTARLIAAWTWLGLSAAEQPDFMTALSLVMRRYLSAYGPASVADIARWAGQRRLGPLRAVIASWGEAVRELEGPDGRRLIDLADLALASGDETAPARFLARWDSVILGYERRDRILPETFAPSVVQKSHGDVLPTFTVDGWIAGTWSTATDRTGATIELRPLRAVEPTLRRGVSDEAERLIRFVEPNAGQYRVVWVDH